jgi:hypothetical protein
LNLAPTTDPIYLKLTERRAAAAVYTLFKAFACAAFKLTSSKSSKPRLGCGFAVGFFLTPSPPDTGPRIKFYMEAVKHFQITSKITSKKPQLHITRLQGWGPIPPSDWRAREVTGSDFWLRYFFSFLPQLVTSRVPRARQCTST